MASLRKRGKVWYFRFVDADGVKVEQKGCPDRQRTLELARDGRRVIASARRREELEMLVGAAAGLSGVILPLPLDVTDRASIAPALDAIEAAEGPIDLAVLAAMVR